MSSDGVDFIVERPEDNSVPDVIVLDEEPGDHVPIHTPSSSDEEDDGEDVFYVAGVGPVNPLLLIEDDQINIYD